MKFNFDKAKMLKAISIAQEVITNKSPIAVLSCVKLEAEDDTLRVSATDSTVDFITTVDIELLDAGTSTIFCSMFASILSSLPSGKSEFSTNDTGAEIRSLEKRVHFTVKSIATEKFPEIKSMKEPTFEIPAKDFKELITQTIFCVSDDSNRYFMTGVHFTKEASDFIMVATNARRLGIAHKTIVCDKDIAAIVPTKILRLVQKTLGNEGNISVGLDESVVYFHFDEYDFACSLINGKFPNYTKVIPETFTNSFEINKEDLEMGLARVKVMTNDKVTFHLTQDTLQLTTRSMQLGDATEEVPCVYSGPEITLVFTYQYIAEPLHVIEGEDVIFEFTEPLKAVTIKSKTADYFKHVVMPVAGE